jgi:hypothetical protein
MVEEGGEKMEDRDIEIAQAQAHGRCPVGREAMTEYAVRSTQ